MHCFFRTFVYLFDKSKLTSNLITGCLIYSSWRYCTFDPEIQIKMGGYRSMTCYRQWLDYLYQWTCSRSLFKALAEQSLQRLEEVYSLWMEFLRAHNYTTGIVACIHSWSHWIFCIRKHKSYEVNSKWLVMHTFYMLFWYHNSFKMPLRMWTTFQ